MSFLQSNRPQNLVFLDILHIEIKRIKASLISADYKRCGSQRDAVLSTKPLVNAGHRWHRKRKDKEKVLCKQRSRCYQANIFMGLLRIVPFLQDVVERDQLIAEPVTLIRS